MKAETTNIITERFSNYNGRCSYLVIETTPRGGRIRIILDNDSGADYHNRTEGWFWNGSEWTLVYEVRNSEYAAQNHLPKADCHAPGRESFTKQTFKPYVDHVREVVLQVVE